MAKNLAPYRTYVIRCWEEQSAQPGTSIYRFTLEIPVTGERFGFTNLEELIDELKFALAQIQTETIANVPPEDEVNQIF